MRLPDTVGKHLLLSLPLYPSLAAGSAIASPPFPAHCAIIAKSLVCSHKFGVYCSNGLEQKASCPSAHAYMKRHEEKLYCFPNTHGRDAFPNHDVDQSS